MAHFELESIERGARAPLSDRALRSIALRTLATVNVTAPVNLSVAFVNQRRSEAINRQYRGKQKPADVLSFRLDDPALHPRGARAKVIVGEIILCPPRIRLRARQEGGNLESQTRRLFVHGLLHVLGYHHHSDTAFRTMQKLEHSILHSS